MKKAELIEMIKAVIEKNTEVSLTKKQAAEIVDEIFENILEAVKGNGEVIIPHIGKLKLVETAPRKGVTNGIAWEKPAGKTIRLRLSKSVKESLWDSFS